MTSIQDWSKWNRMYGNPNIPSAALKKDEDKALRASMQMAERNGYFLNLDSEYLLNEFGPPKPVISESEAERHKLALMLQNLDATKEDKDKKQRKDFLEIKFINLGNQHLRVLGPIEFCRNLRILVLSNNYLTQFDALLHCKHLVKLDVHGNQISHLPSTSMWAHMRQLQILFLHDNPIAKRSAVHGLMGCRSLVYLTLFDTPISLKRNYRHHMVNNVMSLKALDRYVISDEEIIEDLAFGGASRFATFHPSLRIAPLLDDPKCKSLESAEQTVRRQLRGISQAQKRASPVVIVQRFARGWLARRHLRGLRQKPPEEQGSFVPDGKGENDAADADKQTTLQPPPPSRRTTALTVPAQSQSAEEAASAVEEKTHVDFDDYVKRLDVGRQRKEEEGNEVVGEEKLENST